MFGATALVFAATLAAADPTPAEKAFKEVGDFLAGGVWTGTDARGEKYEQRLEWTLNKSFLKTAWSITGDAGEGLAGIDPVTGKLAWWSFDDKGRLWTGTYTIEKAGVWVEEGTGKSKTGQANSWRAKFTKLEGDRLRLEIQDNVVDGKKFPAEVITLTRKK